MTISDYNLSHFRIPAKTTMLTKMKIGAKFNILQEAQHLGCSMTLV